MYSPWIRGTSLVQAEELGIDSKIMRTAREINDSMPIHMLTLLENELRKHDKELSTAKNLYSWFVL